MSKGLSTVQNRFDQSDYQSLLNNLVSGMGENRGFVVRNNEIFTYTQKRQGLSYFYGKRIVLDDAVHTKPLLL